MPLYTLGDHAVTTPGAGRFWVAPTAVVVGQVTLEEDVSVWFGATVRGDNEPIRIGARTNIQENCVLHVDPGFPMVIGEECTIGHLAMLHGCHIGRGALIGIGAIVLNGARVGAGSIVGAGALIPEGKEIPPNSVVFGTPGKVAREVSDKDRARIAGGVADYMARWKRYTATMKPQGG
jgi:carbonic anhydrase/acetyltransferase-like protein (isoleucine patch superfamily)